MSTPTPSIRAWLIAAYLLSIPAGVLAIDTFGVVPIPGGFYAPAAVYVVGITLVLRDLVHERYGWRVAMLAVLAGALLSAAFNPRLALASGVAFACSEILDLLVYERIRRRVKTPLGILASNAVSIPVDSIIFLYLAFGAFDFLGGQIVGKALATVAAVSVLIAVKAVRR